MNLTNLMYVIFLYALFNHELPSGYVARGLGGRCPFLENSRPSCTGSEQPCLVEGVPAHWRRIVLKEL